jgi:hypothetical protein
MRCRVACRLSATTRLGLPVFEPGIFVHRETTGRFGLAGGISWVEITRDDERFLGFLRQVLEVLECPDVPRAGARDVNGAFTATAAGGQGYEPISGGSAGGPSDVSTNCRKLVPL